jgi:hypothetical protein
LNWSGLEFGALSSFFLVVSAETRRLAVNFFGSRTRFSTLSNSALAFVLEPKGNRQTFQILPLKLVVMIFLHAVPFKGERAKARVMATVARSKNE